MGFGGFGGGFSVPVMPALPMTPLPVPAPLAPATAWVPVPEYRWQKVAEDELSLYYGETQVGTWRRSDQSWHRRLGPGKWLDGRPTLPTYAPDLPPDWVR